MTASSLDLENATGIIHRAMASKQLRKENVDPGKGLINAHGLGSFTCPNIGCGKKWSSHFSWARFDLREERLDKRWKMKCSLCLSECEAYFYFEELFQVALKAVCRYKQEKYVPPEERRRRPFYAVRQPPHNNTLCEKCEWGRKLCWADAEVCHRKYYD